MTLLFNALLDADAPEWKRENEAIYEVTSPSAHAGKFVCVRVYRTGKDLDGDGTEDLVHVEVKGRLADPETGETVMIAGRAVETAAHNETLVINQTESGELDVGVWLATCYEEAIPRVLNKISSLNTVSLIPMAA